MRGTGVDHLDLVVASLARSLPLYAGLLGPLGYTTEVERAGERGERIVYLSGRGRVPLGLREAQAPGGFDRYAVGVHHVAFEAPSRASVDERHAWARANGFAIESAPREYDYRPAPRVRLTAGPPLARARSGSPSAREVGGGEAVTPLERDPACDGR